MKSISKLLFFGVLLISINLHARINLPGPFNVQQRLNMGESPLHIYKSNRSLIDSLYGKNYEGGIIFYLDTVKGSGLVCMSYDLPATTWGCNGTWINTSDAFGQGYQNTLNIINGCSDASIAAKACKNVIIGKYNDWYLPSKAEIKFMNTNLAQRQMGDFKWAQYYWTSCQMNANWNAWAYRISDDVWESYTKNSTLNVRAIRKFTYAAPVPQQFARLESTVESLTDLRLSCNFSNSGGLQILAKGFCYSLSAQPDTTKFIIQDSTVDDHISGLMSNFIIDTIYHIRAFTIDINGVTYSRDTFLRTPKPAVGLNYRNGRIVYIDATGEHGLIAALNDFIAGTDTTFRWNCCDTSICTYDCMGYGEDTSYGKGQANCQRYPPYSNAYCANNCSAITLNGVTQNITAMLAAYKYAALADQSDTTQWFLPSLDELIKVFNYNSTTSALNLSTAFYWTSSWAPEAVPFWRKASKDACCWQAWYIVGGKSYYKDKGWILGKGRIRAVKYF
jgi:hypothetical protein